jgi:hypothetical protein
MLLSTLLLSLPHLAPLPVEGSLLAVVPEDAYALAHCRDTAGLRARTELNDWYRLLASAEGEPLLSELAREFQHHTRSEMDELLAMAKVLQGEAVFFDTGKVAGFVVDPPANRAALADLMRAWIPSGEAARRTLEVAGGAVELVAWPDDIGGWAGRAGHFAAFVDHPQALAIYSGDDSAAVVAAVTEGVTRLGGDAGAPLVSSYLAAGGGHGGGVELFVDFTPLVEAAEAALKEAVEGFLPDPSKLLGLEGGTWMHATADVFSGTRIDCRAQLHLPEDTLVSRLADTFQPLPNTLPADLPRDIWFLWALNWDLKLFYQRAREAYEEAGLGEGLGEVDAGLEAAKGMSGVDPVVDVLNQLAGDFCFYFVQPEERKPGERLDAMDALPTLGLQAGLVDGNAFLTALEKLLAVGGLEAMFDIEEIAGVDAYVFEGDEGVDGGLACLPRALTIAPSRRVLEHNLQALTRVEGASLLHGSRTRAALDENAGACFVWCVEMTPLRVFFLPELEGDLQLPPLEAGQPARDPFDTQLIGSARRAVGGFELELYTR